MSNRWRAASLGDTFPFHNFTIRRCGSSIQDQVQRTSRYLEHQQLTLHRMKSEIEKRVNQHLHSQSARRSTSLHDDFQGDRARWRRKGNGLEPANGAIQSNGNRAIRRSRTNQKVLKKVLPSPGVKDSPAVLAVPRSARFVTGEMDESRGRIKTPPAKPGRPHHSIQLSKPVTDMSSPSTSSSSSPSSRALLPPISVEVNGIIYDTANGSADHKANGDALSPAGPPSKEEPTANGVSHIYSKIRHRFRSPISNDGVSSRSSESSTYSTVIEATNGHQMEKGEGADLIFDSNGAITSGTLSVLLKRLMPNKDYLPEKSYIFTFLLNSRLFISPMDILHEIVQHCIFEQNAKGDNFRKEMRAKFFHNVLKLMSEWTETFPYDFRHEKMKERLKLLLELCCTSTDPPVRSYKSVLLQNVANKVSKLERYEKALVDLHRDVCCCIHPSEIFSGIAEKWPNPTLIAQQLTHIELERLSMIGPEEFIHAFANECSSKDTTQFLLNQVANGTKTARNVDHYVDWCNRLSHLVATEICRHMKKKHRVRVMEFFIDVAKECFNMGNFNSLMAIVGGMDMNAVSRLKKTWAKVDVSKLAILEHQLDPSGNFLSYRSTLKAAVWRSAGATKESEKIIVPFFSLLWKDLLVSYEGCAKQLPNGHLNFAMFSQFASQMTQFLQWKDIECPFEKNDAVLRYILTSPLFTDKALQLVSFEYEPAETQAEKELQKTLKSSTAASP